jgi:DNA-binding SARP family transcriptional activator
MSSASTGRAWVEFRILGPLRVLREGGVDVALPSAFKPRLTLAVLLARAGHDMSTDALVAAVWPDQPPASARDLPPPVQGRPVSDRGLS